MLNEKHASKSNVRWNRKACAKYAQKQCDKLDTCSWFSKASIDAMARMYKHITQTHTYAHGVYRFLNTSVFGNGFLESKEGVFFHNSQHFTQWPSHVQGLVPVCGMKDCYPLGLCERFLPFKLLSFLPLIEEWEEMVFSRIRLYGVTNVCQYPSTY